MKVKDLLSALVHLDPEMDIIHQKDAEGNGYSEYVYFGVGNYSEKAGGEVHSDDLGDYPDARKVIFIYPA